VAGGVRDGASIEIDERREEIESCEREIEKIKQQSVLKASKKREKKKKKKPSLPDYCTCQNIQTHQNLFV
jgi:hypothetical protein